MESIIYFIQGWFEYISETASLLLSVIAIWATLYTVSKQNKTALFEKRLEVLRLLDFISVYAASIKNSFNSTSDISLKDNDSKDSEVRYKEYIDMNVTLLSVWVNQRLIYSKRFTDDKRIELMSRAMKGKRDQELIDIMEPYFFHDLGILHQGIYIFKGPIANEIEETADSYKKFIDNLMAIPYGHGFHSGENAKKYCDDFVKAGLRWSENSKVKKKLDKDMRIV